MTSELVLMLLGDARLPVGGHVHSGGLEPALLAGLSPADIRGYLRTRLRTTTRTDAATAVLTRAAVLAADDISVISDAWCARTPGDVARSAALTLGRGVIRLTARLWPGHPATAAMACVGAPYRPLAIGALAAATGLDAHGTALVVAHDDAQAIAAAALKLEPMDPLEATRWVLAAHPEIAAVADEVATVASPDDIPALAAPLAECWTQWHQRHDRRLFLA